MDTKMLKVRPFKRGLAGAALALACSCGPLSLWGSHRAVREEAVAAHVLLPDGTSFDLPNGYHETPSAWGRSFHMRGTAKPSYHGIEVQRREPSGAVLLDEAFDTVIHGLEDLAHFDLLDVQLSFVGPHLAISYAVDFEYLEVVRRQWGALIGTDSGIVAIFMTSPKDAFIEASDDYMSLLTSLHVSHSLSDNDSDRTPSP